MEYINPDVIWPVKLNVWGLDVDIQIENKNYFKIKNTLFVKKRYKKNQTSSYSAYQISTKNRRFLIKGCEATLLIEPLICLNINRLSDVR